MTTTNRIAATNEILTIVSQAVELQRDLDNSEFAELVRRLRLIRASVEVAMRLAQACEQSTRYLSRLPPAK